LSGFLAALALVTAPALLAGVAPQTPQALGILEPRAGTMALPNQVAGSAQVGSPVRVRFDLIAQAAASGGAIEIPLTNGVVVTALVTHAKVAGDQMFIAGPLTNGQEGEASFTTVGDILVGRVVVGRRLFMVRHAPNSIFHVVSEIDPAAFPPDSEPIVPDGLVAGVPAGLSGIAAGATSAPDTGQFVDIMVLYTNAAATWEAQTYGGAGETAIQADVIAAVNNGNLALQNSGLTYQFRLVHQELTSYTEQSPNFSLDLDNLRTNVVPGVAALRDQYSADTVTLIGRYTGVNCGLGYVMGSNSISVAAMAPFAFNVVGDFCANANLSLAHETGHNMGLAHDRFVAGNNPSHAFPYAFGYVAATKVARDVMAYPDDCAGCPRLAIYSTPLANFPGVTPATVAGVADSPGSTTSADNTLALWYTMPVVANFRAALTCSFTVTPTTATSYTAAAGSGLVSVTTSDPSCTWTATANASMLSIVSGGSGTTGNGTVNYAVKANGSVARSGTLTIAGQDVTISQEAPCGVVSFSPAAGTIGWAGGTGTVSVGIASTCAWTAKSENTAIATITAGSAGTGPGTVTYHAAVYAGIPPRTVTLTIAGQSFVLTQTGALVVVSHPMLRYGATKAGSQGALVAVTPAQNELVSFDGIAPTSWTASVTSVTPNQPWVQITNGAGSGAGSFTVGITNDPNNVLGTTTTGTATITVSAPSAGLSTTVTVNLAVNLNVGTSAPPIGAFDTPADGATGLQGSFAVTGWALDDIAIDRVEIWRDRVDSGDAPGYTTDSNHPGFGKIFIANGTFIEGSRSDLENNLPYSSMPMAYRGGWGYLLLSWGLYDQGNHTYKLYAFAFDKDGHSSQLGTKTITVDNAHATKPFGALDTPGYGDTVSGSFWNYGWALTPQPNPSDPRTCTVTTVQMTIDGVPPYFPVSYGALRNDIAASFPGFSNGSGAGGAYFLDTTAYANGTHNIGWFVTDSCGRQDGVGSRFFTVQNPGTSPDPAAGGATAWFRRLYNALFVRPEHGAPDTRARLHLVVGHAGSR
jgi:hypothetical protein